MIVSGDPAFFRGMFPELTTATISNAIVCGGPDWFVVNDKRILLPEVYHLCRSMEGAEAINYFKLGESGRINMLLPNRVTEFDEGFLLGGHSNHYHFLVEYLSRLYFFDALGSRSLPVIGRAHTEVQRDFISAFIDHNMQFLDMPPPVTLAVRSLTVCDQVFDFQGRLKFPEFSAWIRNKARHLSDEGVRPR